jgi:DnaJ-related protein SCJ1
MKVPREGMPIFEGQGHGDLFIEFNVVLPERISPELRKSQSVADSGSPLD